MPNYADKQWQEYAEFLGFSNEKEMLETTYTYKEWSSEAIGDLLGYTSMTILRRLKKLGISRRKPCHKILGHKRTLSKIKIEEIKRAYKLADYKPEWTAIGKRLGVDRKTVRHYALGLERLKEEKMYGKSFHIDLGECDISLFNRHDIDRFFTGIGKIMDILLEDRYFWDDENVPEEEKQTDPKKVGISAVQFLLASNITIHTLPLLRQTYIDIFSCELFDISIIYDYCIKFFDARKSTATPLSRGTFNP